MLQRNISRETIKLLTEMLVDLAKQEGNNFRKYWEPEPTEMDRNAMERHLAGQRDALVTIYAEPDFLLCFRFPQDFCNRAHVVDLQTMPDRVIRHTWSEAVLIRVARQLA